jgi:uroporphyrinogen III methyltransferase/synthase
LETIAGILKEKDIKPPAVMVVGEVVRLRESLNWYEKKPMFGHRILVTREHLEGFEPLEDLGAEILAFPTIEIVPPKKYDELDNAIETIETYHWLIFTSRNGVRYFLKRFFEKDRDIRDLKGIKICTIGNRTAREIKKYGLKVDLIPERFHAEGLIEAIITMQTKKRKSKIKNPKSKILKGVRFLLPRAEVAREVFPETVRRLGGEIDVPVVYRTIKPESHGKRLRRFLREGKITIATFTSAATFNNFREIIGADIDKLLKGVAIAVIGPVTAKAIKKAGLRVDIMPRESTIDEMVAEIMKWAMGSDDRRIAKSE